MNLIIAASNNTSYGITQVITFLILLIITIITAFGFFYILFYKICTKCVNFSCPFNKVEDKIQQSYLEHNPMMKEAWENSDTKKNE